jgi:hypothetical protein
MRTGKRPQCVHPRLITALAIIFVLLLSGCAITINGPGKPADAEPPPEEMPVEGEGGGILFFDVDHKEIMPGECVVLEWETEGGSGVFLNGEEVDPVGRLEECLQETTPFVLEVNQGDSVDGRELLVLVGEGEPGLMEEPPPGEEPPPEEAQPEEPGPEPEEMPGEAHFELELFAEREELAAGECTIVAWGVHGPEERDVMVLLNGDPVERFGEREVCPDETSIFALEATAEGFGDYREVVIHVVGEPEPGPEPPPEPTPVPQATQPSQPAQPSQPVVIDFWVDNNSINSGDCTTLRWHVEHANAVHLDGAGVTGDGTKKICPTTTSVYVLHVAHDAGATEKKVTVKVAGAATPLPTPPGGGSWGVLTADLAVTDLYPDKQPVGKVFARITNHGPQSVSNVPVALNCSVSETDSKGGKGVFPLVVNVTVSLDPGKSQNVATGISIDTTKYKYVITCVPQVQFNDPKTNDDYQETIP